MHAQDKQEREEIRPNGRMLALKSKVVRLPTVPPQFTITSTASGRQWHRVGKSHPTATLFEVCSRRNTAATDGQKQGSLGHESANHIPSHLPPGAPKPPHHFIENYSLVTGAPLGIPAPHHRHPTSAFPETVPVLCRT